MSHRTNDRVVHSYCVQLMGHEAFHWFLQELGVRRDVAVGDATSRLSHATRDFDAGRANGLGEAIGLVQRRYDAVRAKVEVVDE